MSGKPERAVLTSAALCTRSPIGAMPMGPCAMGPRRARPGRGRSRVGGLPVPAVADYRIVHIDFTCDS